MMKKITRIAALLAATALLFGAIGCDDGGSGGGNGGDGDDDGNNNNGNAVTYVWDFATPDLAALATETSTDENTSGKPKIPAESYYESTPAGLTLTLPAGGVFNKIDATTSNSKVSGIGASKGAIEPSKGSDLTVKVKGPFTAVMLCGANSDSDKTDRYAYIKADGEEVVAPSKDNNTLKGSGEALTYAYEGTDEVTLAFGVSSGYVRIYDIKITTENGDGDGKTAGEVTSSASFEAQSTTVANNEETLGLTGATLAIDEAGQAVVAAEFDETKANIKVTSKSAGTATITVKDESGEKTATIKATVTGAGKITTTVTKYTAPAAPGADDFSPITVFDGSTMSAISDLPSCVDRIDTASKQAVDSNNKSLNGKSFTSRFKFGGKDTDTHNANALKINTGTTAAVKVVVYAMCSSSANTGSVKAAGSGDAVTLLTNSGSSLAASEEVAVTPDSDGNIFIWAADNAMNIYYLHISQ